MFSATNLWATCVLFLQQSTFPIEIIVVCRRDENLHRGGCEWVGAACGRYLPRSNEISQNVSKCGHDMNGGLSFYDLTPMLSGVSDTVSVIN